MKLDPPQCFSQRWTKAALGEVAQRHIKLIVTSLLNSVQFAECTVYIRKLIFTFVPCILILSKYYLFTNRYNSELSLKTILKFTLTLILLMWRIG